MATRFYRESVGECVSQVYDVEASTWEEAKKIAFSEMSEGDILAECMPDAVKEDGYPEYHTINMKKCKNYAKLERGIWGNRLPSGEEYWESNAWYFSDDSDTYLNANGEEFEAWEHDKVDVEYGSGESRNNPGKAIDYMLVKCGETELYAEEENPTWNEEQDAFTDESATYDSLKAKIKELAQQMEIPVECLEFCYD